MRKRILAFVLSGLMLLSGISADAVLAAPVQEAVSAGEGTQHSEQPLERSYPRGGYLQPKAIKITAQEAAEAFPEETDNGFNYYEKSYGSQQYSSFWDKCSSNYIYNQLSEKERKFWDALDNMCRAYLTSTRNAIALRYDGGSANVLGEIINGQMEVPTYQAKSIYIIFVYSNPQYYFLDNSYGYGKKIVSGQEEDVFYPGIYNEFVRGSVRKTETAKFKAQIDNMKNKILQGTDDVEKAKIANDLITAKIKYDSGFSFIPELSNPYTPFHQSAYSVFCDNYTVCAGYTKAFQILMNLVGIDTLGVTSIDHAWNLICFNDSWYCMDLTWNDMDGKEGMVTQYLFFGVSEARLGELDSQNSHKKEAMYTGLTPKCTKDFGSTKTSVGNVYVPTQTAAAPVISQKKNANNITVTLRSGTPGAEIYYTMDGKNPSSSFTRSYRYTGTFKVTSDVKVKAVAVQDGMWDSPVAEAEVKGRMYTVKFDTKGGGKISSQKVWPQGIAKKPSNPKRAKYSFEGWYKDSKCKNKWNFKNIIQKNTTIYAKWNKVKVANTSIQKLKNTSSGKVTVAVKKLKKAKGYQIRYSTSPNMTAAKKKEIKTTSKVLSGLRKDVTYYVQVRAYQKDSAGKKIYGNWSRSKSVTIRK